MSILTESSNKQYMHLILIKCSTTNFSRFVYLKQQFNGKQTHIKVICKTIFKCSEKKEAEEEQQHLQHQQTTHVMLCMRIYNVKVFKRIFLCSCACTNTENVLVRLSCRVSMEQFYENNKVYLYTKCNSQTKKEKEKKILKTKSTQTHTNSSNYCCERKKNAWKTLSDFLKGSLVYGYLSCIW